MTNLLLIAFFGAMGAVSRYSLILITPRVSYFNHPVGTILVNLIGSFLIGIVISLFNNRLIDKDIEQILIFGFLGGFTTFSAFTYELFLLIKSENYLNVFIYLFSSIVIGLFLFYLGYKLVKIFI
jgi:CrcB protein